MTLVDHLLMLIFAVGYQIYAAVENRRYVREIKAGKPVEVFKEYRGTMIHQWIGFAILTIAWYARARPAADLGVLAPGGTGFYLSLGMLVVVCCFLVISWRSVKNMSIEKKAKQVEALGDVMHFLPRTPRDHRSFFALSITAGIVEEIVYRGFFIWYLAHFVPVWGAVIVSAVIFGLSHAYQGVAGIMRVTLIGLLFGVLYVVSGSIWIPMVAHALFDMLQGRTIHELFRDETS